MIFIKTMATNAATHGFECRPCSKALQRAWGESERERTRWTVSNVMPLYAARRAVNGGVDFGDGALDLCVIQVFGQQLGFR